MHLNLQKGGFLAETGVKFGSRFKSIKVDLISEKVDGEFEFRCSPKNIQ